ncbi:Ndufb11, NADH dehydrogenase 1 beta subcomplex subunit [Thelephora terrestris]|uniref:NADH dehydrogenase [ubiquinone] 1 beta subcomplex subunit 11, mitochondrial n=1 Tax=Thelephora terrestris TaxID=56493 RepID=A0A9P6HJ49_9AGAM|nr:Ndufb11, NADH dehydrogenase 1 beta subcomplex subunit [Thelephora terrestris]
MPPLPQSLRSSVRCTRRGPRSVPPTFSRSASHGAPHYNEPTGFVFGEKPPAPGQKRQREEWELIWYVGMFGTFAAATVAVYYKPDTSIQTWALVEAKKRMEARGEATDYVPKP